MVGWWFRGGHGLVARRFGTIQQENRDLRWELLAEILFGNTQNPKKSKKNDGISSENSPYLRRLLALLWELLLNAKLLSRNQTSCFDQKI